MPLVVELVIAAVSLPLSVTPRAAGSTSAIKKNRTVAGSRPKGLFAPSTSRINAMTFNHRVTLNGRDTAKKISAWLSKK